MEDRVVTEGSSGARSLKDIVDFGMIYEIIRDKAIWDAGDCDLIVASLFRRGADGVGTRGSHTFDLSEDIVILSGFKDREIIADRNQTEGSSTGLLDDFLSRSCFCFKCVPPMSFGWSGVYH